MDGRFRYTYGGSGPSQSAHFGYHVEYHGTSPNDAHDEDIYDPAYDDDVDELLEEIGKSIAQVLLPLFLLIAVCATIPANSSPSPPDRSHRSRMPVGGPTPQLHRPAYVDQHSSSYAEDMPRASASLGSYEETWVDAQMDRQMSDLYPGQQMGTSTFV